MTRRQALVPLLLLALTTCRQEDMFSQRKAIGWGTFSGLPNGMTMQHPVSGTIARGTPDGPVSPPPTMTAALLARGQKLFNINCVPCHGSSGDGEGMIVQRGFPKPPPLFSPELIKAKAQHFYDVITNGRGAMYSYADRVAPADRWAIAAYIRALQFSQHAQVADLADADKQRLQEAGP